MLTKKQIEVLKAIEGYIKENEISPTVREVADLIGIKSTSTAQGYINRLKVKGYISNIKESPRSIRILRSYSKILNL
jgi:SOS-response transcriptional repressor LexA